MEHQQDVLSVRRRHEVKPETSCASTVLAAFLGALDREFCYNKCLTLTLLQAYNYAYVMPIVRWGQTIKQELAEGWSRVIHTT